MQFAVQALPATWAAASDACAAQGGRLPELRSAFAFFEYARHVLGTGLSGERWIGMWQRDGVWEWAGGEALQGYSPIWRSDGAEDGGTVVAFGFEFVAVAATVTQKLATTVLPYSCMRTLYRAVVRRGVAWLLLCCACVGGYHA